MATDTTGATERSTGHRIAGATLDAAVAVLSLLMVTGIALDFRSHAQGISFAEEGFFTPEHTFFYSMFLGIAAVLFAVTYSRRRDGATWAGAVPAGYGWGLVGVVVFGLAGLGDLGWHTTFGFEEGFEALTSPSHLGLGAGAVLFLGSPLRASFRRSETPSGRELVPALCSASLVLTILVLFSAYVNPLTHPEARHTFGQATTVGLVELLVFPTLLVGVALALARQFDLPFGAITGVFLGPALASTVINAQFEFVLPVVAAGLVGDALIRVGPPTTSNPRLLRAFGALVPATFVAGFFAVVELNWGIAWTVHVWTGAIVLAAMFGLLLTYAILPDATQP
jgi:hypothetical protein